MTNNNRAPDPEEIASIFCETRAESAGRPRDFFLATVDAEGVVIDCARITDYGRVVSVTQRFEKLGFETILGPASPDLQDFDVVFAPKGSAVVQREADAIAKRAVRPAQAPKAAAIDDLYRDMARQLPAGAAFIVDQELRYQLAEGQSLEDTGMTPAQIEGRTVREVVPPPFADVVESDFRLALLGGGFHREHPVGERWFSTQGIALRNASGEVFGALAVSYDITAAKQAEERLRAKNEALSKKNRRNDIFLATLAHELRNPLAPISMGVELLRRIPLNTERAHRTLDILRDQVGQISRLIEDLVDVARVEEGKLRVDRGPVGVRQVSTLATDACRPLIEALEHQLEVMMPEGEVLIEADSARLVQILSNLLNNAAKFTPRGGKIQLAATESSDAVEFRVKDNGPGLAPDQVEQVFDMFSQIPNQQNAEARAGLGIGLTLVRKLAELHGGSASVESEGLGKGCTFVVRLPRVQPAARRRADAPGFSDSL